MHVTEKGGYTVVPGHTHKHSIEGKSSLLTPEARSFSGIVAQSLVHFKVFPDRRERWSMLCDSTKNFMVLHRHDCVLVLRTAP